jgi:hypothetical protein
MGSVGRIGDDAVVRGAPPLQIVRPEVRRGRMVRIRVWLASAMWFPVLAANLLAIALGMRCSHWPRSAVRPTGWGRR